MNHSLDANYIEVSVEHQGRSIAWPHARYDVGTARRTVDQPNGEAPIVEHGREGASAITLARRLRSEGGISRVDLYQSAGERDRVATRYDHGLPFRGLAGGFVLRLRRRLDRVLLGSGLHRRLFGGGLLGRRVLRRWLRGVLNRSWRMMMPVHHRRVSRFGLRRRFRGRARRWSKRLSLGVRGLDFAHQLVGLFLGHLAAAHHVLEKVAGAFEYESGQSSCGTDDVLHGRRHLAARLETYLVCLGRHLGDGIFYIGAAMPGASPGWNHWRYDCRADGGSRCCWSSNCWLFSIGHLGTPVSRRDVADG